MHTTDTDAFRSFINSWYVLYGRHSLPWRLTTDPYVILLSELMLQQTQVSRVIPKYAAFLQSFPTIASLRTAQLADVLKLWQGLGYNRRAKYLWQLAQHVDHLPTSESELLQLPGIGPYTASAICAFAFNQPVVMIETNIRTVFLYHFFPHQQNVADKDVLPLVSTTMDRSNPRQWYWALMDYGSYLKSIVPNPSRTSRHHTKQTKFAGSVRQTRGEIIRLLLEHDKLSQDEMVALRPYLQTNITQALYQLESENMIVPKSGQWRISQGESKTDTMQKHA